MPINVYFTAAASLSALDRPTETEPVTKYETENCLSPGYTGTRFVVPRWLLRLAMYSPPDELTGRWTYTPWLKVELNHIHRHIKRRPHYPMTWSAESILCEERGQVCLVNIGGIKREIKSRGRFKNEEPKQYPLGDIKLCSTYIYSIGTVPMVLFLSLFFFF